MQARQSLIERVSETLDLYMALGNECQRLESPGAMLVRNRGTPDVWDANHVSGCRPKDEAQADRLLEAVASHYAGQRHRCFRCDVTTPALLPARLLLEGYAPQAELELLLEGELDASPRPTEIRLAASEDDAAWERIVELQRIDDEEAARKAGRAPHAPSVSQGLVDGRRAKAPEVRTWLAREDGVDCAFFSSWPGPAAGGSGSPSVGKVEDLFTHPDFRGRGIAKALIAHAVGDARERGAGPVVIGALPEDTPKHLYAALGFRPFLVRFQYLKHPS